MKTQSPRDAIALSPTKPIDRERAWRRVRKCRRQLGSDPDGIGQPYLEKPARMLLSR